jgi:deoxycytidylate deaminase
VRKIADPELVIGIVGRIGVDTQNVYSWLEQILHALHYTTHHIKITNYLKTKQFEVAIVDSPIEQRYRSYISACNHVREIAKRNDFLVSYAVQTIIEVRRSKNKPGEEDLALPRTAFLIDQIKRPEEVTAFKDIYGDQFILVSSHIPMDKRRSMLASKIASGHAGMPKTHQWDGEAKDLIEIDDKEANAPFGQRVSDVFPLADVIIDASDQVDGRKPLERFFEALFGNFRISPTKDEFFQNLAYQVSLTSCDTARQVGAVIQRNGDIVSTGFNEAPKAGGGTYWAQDGKDARDVALGRDQNTVRKRQMLTEIVQILRDRGHLKNDQISDAQIEENFIDGKDAPLKKTQIMDSLEYGRAVHAEMAAITAAARHGLFARDGILYCTTFPCPIVPSTSFRVGFHVLSTLSHTRRASQTIFTLIQFRSILRPQTAQWYRLNSLSASHQVASLASSLKTGLRTKREML